MVTETYEQKATKYLKQKLKAKMQKISCLNFYATVVPYFSFLEKIEVLEVGGVM